MSLREKDCKIGAEIICINNTTRNGEEIKHVYSEWIKVGNIYTIRELKRSVTPRVGIPIITLNEIQGWKTSDGLEAAFHIWRFKLLNPKDIQIFYDILDKPLIKEKDLVDS